MHLRITSWLVASNLCAAGLPAFAAETSQGVGMVAGGLTGAGLSYRQTFSNGFGYGVGLGAAWLNSQPGLWYDAGLIGTKSLADLQFGRLYALVGSAVYQFDPSHPARGLFGAGIGIETGPADGITLALDVPLVYLPDSQQVLPIPSLSMHYKWAEPHIASRTSLGSSWFTRQGMGFAAGAAGVGFSYRAWHDSGFGGSLTGFAFGSQSAPVTSVGIGLNELLSDANGSRFYLTSAVHNLGDSTGNRTLAGIGYGMEIGSSQGLVLNLDLLMCTISTDPSVFPLPNVGLTFYF